jgi:hypothetical protein
LHERVRSREIRRHPFLESFVGMIVDSPLFLTERVAAAGEGALLAAVMAVVVVPRPLSLVLQEAALVSRPRIRA